MTSIALTIIISFVAIAAFKSRAIVKPIPVRARSRKDNLLLSQLRRP